MGELDLINKATRNFIKAALSTLVNEQNKLCWTEEDGFEEWVAAVRTQAVLDKSPDS